jgi:DNA modification methylase
VECVITSPPYFGLRNYGHRHQIGLEDHIDQWVHQVLGVCRELARVLKPSGALWLNVGDGYSRNPREGAPTKGLLLGPQRLVLGLLEQGWLVRNQVVWAKTNPIPNSAVDRLTNAHEVIFLLVRSNRYFFDLDVIREPHGSAAHPRRTVRPGALPASGLPSRKLDGNHGLSRMKAVGLPGHPLGKSPGDTWTFPTSPGRSGHSAVFPPVLIERPLLATCPEKVCVRCGQPWCRSAVNRQRAATLGVLRPNCDCKADTKPGIVLDPFMGSGTVALVAEQHGRDWIGIELNPAYVALAERRVVDYRATRGRHE